ncbi:hypothetical protein CspeluHIS016_0109650 [Cutaneotrichosporon spelunceum]|uniref:Prenylcysteine lyase domain-containing protein n=1 Tax=Cutaneotrichosporon spelunceum TaxID=1672016 RepID=A0AAD3TPP6_9TREE|nr:hypothetical protein CspeluHIS016_0109650 [Cutaneotrichosporon spelunceum]
MPVPWRRGMPVPYPFYILVVGTIVTLILFVQQPQLATRVAAAASALSPLSLVTLRPIKQELVAPKDLRPRRVAIVGAGASGSAAAFFLSRAAREAESRAGEPRGSLLDIVVYERADYIGGRTTVVYPHGDTNLRPVELGASIFVDANRNLVKAAKLFGLDIVDPEFGDTGVAVWDGTQFLFATSSEKGRWSGWWDTIAALRRYGALSPMRQRSAVGALVKKFSRLYDPRWLANRGSVANVDEFAESADLGGSLTSRKGEDWARNVVKAGRRWVDEIMEASTRVNYCADMTEIHALGAAVSLASGGASAIAGGNFRLFEAMLKHSRADVRLQTAVDTIEPHPGGFRVTSNGSHTVEDYNEVFFAAPWHSSPVSKNISSHFTQPIPKQRYVRLHVTMLATTAPHADPLYFFGSPDDAVPGTILTTGATVRAKPGAARPEFQSISYHGETYEGSGEWVVKVFSKAELSNDLLADIFGDYPTWVYRKVWDSYPALHPTASFPPMQPMQGFHYLAAFEPWVSTMETQTLSAREAVARSVQRWWNLGLGECRDADDSWDMTCGK